MAVPFYLPEENNNATNSNNSSGHTSSVTSSATQTPLQSPVSGEHLVMAFCEALYRCSVISGSPGFQFPPPSPSCSAASPTSPSNSFNGSNVFFPRGRSTPRSPRSNNSFGDDSGVFFRSARTSNRGSIDIQRRSRLTSTGDDDDENEGYSEHETSWDELDDRYENYMAARERLQEFPGQIPPRKRKKQTPKPKPKAKDQIFTWPAVVTVFVFAMGCGFLVAR